MNTAANVLAENYDAIDLAMADVNVGMSDAGTKFAGMVLAVLAEAGLAIVSSSDLEGVIDIARQGADTLDEEYSNTKGCAAWHAEIDGLAVSVGLLTNDAVLAEQRAAAARHREGKSQ